MWCEAFLRSESRHELDAPVIVFCAPDPAHQAENRRRALRAGAFELTSQWWDLFDAIDRVLGD